MEEGFSERKIRGAECGNSHGTPDLPMPKLSPTWGGAFQLV